MRIIICCGADRTGKSTLTDEFVKNGYEYVHFNPPKGSAYKEYRNYLDDVLKNPENKDKNFILDRYMYCEFPYSKHYHRNSDMTVERMHEIEDEILKLDPSATIIYCETSTDSNWKRIEDEGKNEFKSIDELHALKFEYYRILNASRLDVFDYNFECGDTPEKTFNTITNV